MVQRLILSLTLLFACTLPGAQAQSGTEDEPVFAIAEQTPEFPGGQTAIRSYLMKTFEYPEEALEAKVNGPVQVTFVVTKSGEGRDVRVTKGQHPALDAEAVRVVAAMPKWTPGRQHGQAVNVLFTMPIRIATPTR
jgi:TonB family protein